MKILIADDDRNLRKVLRTELSYEGFAVEEASDGSAALELLDKGEYDVLLLDLNMPDVSGMEVLERLKGLGADTQVIVLTADSTASSAVEAMKLGACDYITKPFKIDVLKAVMEKAFGEKELRKENLLLRTQIKRQTETQKIIAQSPLMSGVLEDIGKMAVSAFPVLIRGESGVGKELAARTIHDASERGGGPFIPVGCGSVPEEMLETELFGQEKGAHAGATTRKTGLLEMADHGTAFLDEIGEMPLQFQGKLLRAIETGRFFRAGGTREVSVDVRFIAATERELEKEVEKGDFRQDLYYSISTLSITIPPLRERKEDIPLLLDQIIRQTIRKNPAFRRKKFSKEAIKFLINYPWPGNVRELQNVVHRTLLLSEHDEIRPVDLPPDLHLRKRASKRLEDVEREHILNIMKETDGHRGKAAELLGIDQKTLYRKLHSYGINE